jgi:hypothetical protein
MRMPLALILSLAASPALAHEFELLLLAPPNASEATLDQMRTAFLIASHERDSHPDETSEGHLGGMDVQLTLARLGEAAATEDLAFVVAPLAAPDDEAVVSLAAPGGAVVVDSAHLSALPPALDHGNATLPPFADRFRAETGQDPGPEALAAYLGARLVDLVVRPLDSVDDREALRTALPSP